MIWYYEFGFMSVHTIAKSFKLFLRCLMKKLASLFAIIPLSLLKRLSLLCTLSSHTHPQLWHIGREKSYLAKFQSESLCQLKSSLSGN